MVHIKILNLLKLPQHEQRSPEWFVQRQDKLTSSDAATVIGTNPYSKPDELLLKKCGIEKPFIGNVATLHGQKYEDTAIELYCRITGKRNHNFGLICYSDVNKEFDNYNDNHKFLAGSPDGVAESLTDANAEPILLEIKCPYKRPIIDGYIPEYYVPQVQLNMYICNLEVADFIEYCPRTNKLNIVRLYKDMNWLNKQIELLSAFWKKVEYYRNIGIENSPEYIKKIERDQKREISKEKKRIKLEEESKNTVNSGNIVYVFNEENVENVSNGENEENNEESCITKYSFID